MAINYTLKYRTFQSLVDEVALDMAKYIDQNQLGTQELVKVARRCNYELGLRIYKTKEAILDIERGKAKLPNDFYVINFALALGNGKVKMHYPQGTHVENFPVEDGKVKYKVNPGQPDLCCTAVVVPCSCHLDCNGNENVLVQTFNSTEYEYRELYPIKITSNVNDLNGFCPGKNFKEFGTATISNGWIYTSIQNGKLYINYQGDMEDEDGNLLVPDHEVLNEFYEYALKQRIIENSFLNDEEANANKIQIIEQRYRAARNNAFNIVNTPNFTELRELDNSLRKKWFNKYYSMFK